MNNIAGIYIVELKYGLISLKDINKQTDEYLKYEKFLDLLFQKFNSEQVHKINEAITCSNKLIIDFDKSTVKIIKEKDKDFKQYFIEYFNPKFVENEINNENDIDSSQYLYKGE